LQARLGRDATKVRVIPNGIPSEIFHRPTRPRRPDPNSPARLLFVGQLIPLKGVDVLIQALARLRATDDAELLLVYQNAAMEDAYRSLVEDLGLRHRVRFLGMRSAGELGLLYREVDLLVLPSRSEALPSVITEAMMSGLPVVASAVGGIPEQVGPHGRLVPPGDVDRLAEALRSTLREVRDGRFDPAAISADANLRFGIPAMIDAHLRLYQRLAAETGEPARIRARYRPANAAARLALRTCGDRLTGRGLLAK
jgi:glycosyltransferase involved in cell wall biosynthesis